MPKALASLRFAIAALSSRKRANRLVPDTKVWFNAPAIAAACFLVFSAETGFQLFASTTTLSSLDASYGVGSWIWAEETFDKQTCRLWRDFQIPSGVSVTNARLYVTGDNSYRVFLDGRELGQGFEWRSITVHDLTRLLSPGRHVLAVEAFNEYNEAGVLAGLRIALTDGQIIEVASDRSWRVVPITKRRWATTKHADPRWPPATVVATFGAGPWAWTMQHEAAGTFNSGTWFHITREAPHEPLPFILWRSGWFQMALLAACGIVILLCFRLFSQLAVQRKAHQVLERERVRIARDIHDDLGAGLTELVVFGEVAKNEFPPDSVGCEKFTDVCDRGRRLLRAIDEVVWLVNAHRDTLRDFETYVCSYAEKFLQPTAIRCRTEMDEDTPQAAFDLAIRRNLYLAIKEALNNVARHSEATEMFLRFHFQNNELIVEVEDDGRGFEPGHTDNSRNGLSNMRQRLAEVGGECRVISQPGAGCRIEFRSPLVQGTDAGLSRWRRQWLKLRHTERSVVADPPLSRTRPV